MSHQPTTHDMTAPSLPLLYREPRVLQPGLHGGRALGPSAHSSDYRFAAQAHAVPLLAVEIPAVAKRLPVVFSGGDQPYPVAVLGLAEQQNLCVDASGRWQGGDHVPSYLRRYPFIFLEDDARHELTLCIDEAATVDADPGRPEDPALFDSTGQPSALTRSALAYCRDHQAHHLLTQDFCQAVAQAYLLVDRRADVTLPSGQRLALTGLRVIDEARLNQLPAEQLLTWREQGWLPLVYAHLQSLNNWSWLMAKTKG